jgi:site-specific recombinase XerD
MTQYHKQPVAAPPVVQDFLSYLTGIKNKSQNTAYEYSVDLRAFFIYYLSNANGKKNVAKDCDEGYTDKDLDAYMHITIDCVRNIDRIDIANYLYNLSNKGLAAATRARKLAAVRAYFDYMCYKTYRLEDNPCEMVESPTFKRKLPVFLTEQECVELLAAIRQSTDKNRVRDYFIIALFMCCGLRIDELVGINLGDIRKYQEDDVESLLLVVTGKGNKQRTIYLPEICVEAYFEYVEQRISPKDDKEKALFISQKGQRLSHRAIERMVKKYFNKANLDAARLSPHKLRHTAATNMLNANTDIRVIQQALGHETLQTTQIYTHVSNASLKEAFLNNSLAQRMEELAEENKKTEKSDK